jgi:hypothetical protein
VPLVIVIPTGLPTPVLLPPPEQTPVVVTATGRVEEDEAATLNVLLYEELPGAAVLTVMVWFAF